MKWWSNKQKWLKIKIHTADVIMCCLKLPFHFTRFQSLDFKLKHRTYRCTDKFIEINCTSLIHCMSLNPSKFQAIQVCFKKVIPHLLFWKYRWHPNVNNAKILGIWIQNDHKWESEITVKVNHRLYILWVKVWFQPWQW